MITPQFRLSQTPSHLVITVQVPHIRVSVQSLEVVITDSSVVHFCSPPYLLKLHFSPHTFADAADEACTTYSPDSDGTITLTLKKSTEELWEDLQLLGRLVTPALSYSSQTTTSTPNSRRWLHEVIVENNDESTSNSSSIPIPETPKESGQQQYASQTKLGYGFCRMFQDVFADWSRADGLAQEMLEGPCCWDLSRRQERRTERWKVESSKFSAERYLQDLEIEEDYIYQCAISYKPHWKVVHDESLSDAAFTNDESLQLASIPYPLLPLIDSSDAKPLLLGLVDLLFAYAYDHLTTQGDPTVESAWTIVTLSASLSWLDDWLDEDEEEKAGSVKAVVQSSLRRALIYPYLRNLDFAVFAMQQVAAILQSGTLCILRCLLQMRSILHRSELYYLSNKLYVDPYMAWIQQSTRTLELIYQPLSKEITVCLKSDWKSQLDLKLVDIEATDQNNVSEDESSVDSSSGSSVDDSQSDSDDDDSSTSSSCQDQSSEPPSSSDCRQEVPADEALLVVSKVGALSLNDGGNDIVIRRNTQLPLSSKGPLIQELD